MRSRGRILRKRSYWVNYAHRKQPRGFENEGQLLSAILRRLFLQGKSDALLGYSNEYSDWNDPHFLNLELLANALRSGNLLVEKYHEGSLKGHGVGRSYRIRRKKPVETELANQNEIVVKDEATMLGAIIRIYLHVSVGKGQFFEISTALPMSHQCFEWVVPFAESLGFVAASYDCIGGFLRIGFKKNPLLNRPILASFEDYIAEKEWRLLQYHLSKARRIGKEECEACGGRRRDIERYYDIVTLAIYGDDYPGETLLTFRGQTSGDLARVAELTSGTVLHQDDKNGLIALPPNCEIVAKLSLEDLLLTRVLFDRISRRNLRPLTGHSFVRKREETAAESSGDRLVQISMTCLGGGQEIGANAYLVSLGDRRLLLDCGADVSEKRTNPLGYPYFERIPNLDVAVISHAHADHVMSILTLSRLFPRTPIFCSIETARLLRVLLPRLAHDKSRRMMGDEYGYFGGAECTWTRQFEKNLKPIEFDTRVPVPGLPGVFISLIRAGHVLGAAMTLIEVGDFRILYSGDFCLRDQLTIKGCDMAKVPCSNVLITESTYYGGGRTTVTDIGKIVKDFSEKCKDTVDAKGVILLPCFSLGKAQEVLAIAGEAIRNNMIPGMSHSNIFVRGLAVPLLMEYANSLEDKRAIYDSMVLAYSMSRSPENRGWTPEDDEFKGPRMEIATHGMMIPGTLSNRIASKIINRRDCSIITTGYQPPNSLAARLSTQSHTLSPDSRPPLIYHQATEGWQSRVLRARIDEIGISSHATTTEIERLVEKANPEVLVAVHGESEYTAKLVDWSATRSSVTAAYSPVNLESIALGGASISREVIDEWRRAPIQIADFSSLTFEPESLHVEADEAEYGFLMSCREDPECSMSDDGRSLDVEIDPSSYGYASITLELRPQDNWERLSHLEVIQDMLDGPALVRSLNEVDRNLASRDGYVLRLPPGRYSVKAKIDGVESVQSIVVCLDIGSLIDDWEFDLQNRMFGKIPMLRRHLDSLRTIRVTRDGERSDFVTVDYEKEPSHVFVEFTKRANPSGRFHVDFLFDKGYPDSRATLSFDTSVRPDEVRYDFDFVAPGTCISGTLSDSTCTIDDVEVYKEGICEIESTIDDARKSCFISCTKAPNIGEEATITVKVAVRRLNGYYKHHSKKIRVLPALRCETSFLREMPPSSNQSANFGIISEMGVEVSSVFGIEAILGEQRIAMKTTGSLIRVEFKTPNTPCHVDLKILGSWRSSSRAEFELASLPLRIGYREEVQLEESNLVFSRSSTPELAIRSLVPYDEGRVAEARDSLLRFGPRIQVSDDSKTIRMFLDSMKDDDFPSSEALLDLNFPHKNITVLNLDRISLKVEVQLQSARILLGRTYLPTFEDNVGTYITVLRVEPVLEFKRILRVTEGGFETEKLDPGRYLIRLYHHGKVALDDEFTIPELPFSVTSDTLISRSSFFREFDSLPSAIEELRDYYTSTGECLPSIIAMKHEGNGTIIAGDHERLKNIIQSSLRQAKSTAGRLWIITPGNFVPKYLSDAMIAEDASWIALSYPCPRTNSTESIDDFMRRVMKTRKERVPEIIGIRSIPSGSEGMWYPIMRVLCPRCGKRLHARYREGVWESTCSCEFATKRIGYSLDDLERGEPAVIVTQFAIFDFLIRENRKHGTMGRMSKIIGGPLVCTECRTVFPFSSIERIAQVHREMHTNPGKHRSLLSDGWWVVKPDKSIDMSEKTRLLQNRRCFVCHSRNAGIHTLPETVVGGRAQPVVTMVAGNETLETRGMDAFCIEDHFPETMFPALCDAKNAYEKVVGMIESSTSIWRMESRGLI